MGTLHFLGADPVLRDGHSTNFDQVSDMRCNCMSRAHLVARVRDGRVEWAGCPACGTETWVELGPDGKIGFFPPGITVF